MAAQRIARAKGAILTLLRQSYLNRDHIGIVTFRGKVARVSLEPSRSILRARRVLESLHIGGGTPLAAGLTCTIDLLRRVRDRHGDAVVLLFTDGHANVSLSKSGTQAIANEVELLSTEMKKSGAGVVVVDTQRGFESSQETEELARVLHARFVKLGAV
jgi:magnesium chelatase subunit D